MRRLGRLLALLATIMLVIGASPAVAAAQAPSCNPCPPDCPMMKQRATQDASDHGSMPGKGGKADNPCQSAVACQTAAATPAPSDAVAYVQVSAAAVTHAAFEPDHLRSRPPDRNLRPPIRL